MRRVVYVATILLTLSAVAAGNPQQAAADRQYAGRTTAQWIDQLGGDEYAVRQRATDLLIELGMEVIPVAMAAAAEDDLEVRSRAFRVIVAWAKSDDADRSYAALDALDALTESPNRATAATAKSTLRWCYVKAGTRNRKVVESLRQMNALLRFDQLGRVNRCNLALVPIPRDGLLVLEGLTRLEALDLSGTQIRDRELAHLQGLGTLRDLQLIHTPVTDAGLVHLGKLTHLETLNLFATEVTDAGLIHLKGLTRLKTLRLGATAVTDEGVRRLQKELPKTKISR